MRFLETLSFLHSPRARNVYLVLSVVLPTLVIVGSWSDGTLVLPEPHKGLAQHYGYWALFFTTPTLIVLAPYLLNLFLKHVRRPAEYCVPLSDDIRSALSGLVERHVSSLLLHERRTISILVFAMIAIGFWWLVNAIVMINPQLTYGHDAFDGHSHKFGYFAARAYVLFIFGFVYPIAAFAAVHVTISLVSTLRFVTAQDILRVNLFDPDNCGGTSRFGHINVIILGIYANWFAVVYAMYVTHQRTYAVLAVALFTCTGLAIGQSIIAVYHIHRIVSAKRRDLLKRTIECLDEQTVSSLEPGNRFPNDLLALRTHLLSVHTFPYGSSAIWVVNAIRFAPAAALVASYFRP